MSINDWPEYRRPREKLIRFGATALSDEELLAIFLRVGVKGKNAVELAHDLLQTFGSLRSLMAAPLGRFATINGLGPAKYSLLQAAQELARRSLDEDLRNGVNLNSPQNVRSYLKHWIGNKTYESFVVMFLDVKLCLLACEELFRGGLTHTSVYPREIIKRSIHHNAGSIILAHNHPSGEARPSQIDIDLTHTLQSALEPVEVRVLDHFIVAGNACYSFSGHGLL